VPGRDDKECVVLTLKLGRFLDDFGNVLQYLDADGFTVTIYSSVPQRTSEPSPDSPESSAHYRDLLPPSIVVHETLPYCRSGKLMPWELVQMVVLGFRLARRHPHAMFMLWSMIPITLIGGPLRVCNRRTLFFVTGLGPVLGSHGRRFRFLRGALTAAYAFLMSGRNSRCLNHNRDDKALLTRRLHAHASKFFVTPGCGVDPALFPYFETRAGNAVPIVVVPARLIVDKGIREAIQASSMLRDRGIAHQMWFTGAIEPYLWISITASEVAEAERENPCVKFVGFHESMVPLYERCDVVCLPTRYPEGTPTTLIEAAATGRPAVTCDTVGAREIVVHEQTGFVVPQHDVVALADALQRLLTDDALYERFRQRAHEHFLAHYTKDMALRATLAAFESAGFTFEREMTAPDIRLAHAS
jgi:glycosyltransferase involved in cell wall biosynthesis